MCREVPTEEGKALSEHWDCPFIECSAKENWGVEEVFVNLIRYIEKGSGLLQKNRVEKCVVV